MPTIQYRAELTWRSGDKLCLSNNWGNPLFDSRKNAVDEVNRFLKGPSGGDIKSVMLSRVLTTVVKRWRRK